MITGLLKKIVDQLPKFITLRSKKRLLSDLYSLNISFDILFDVGAHIGEYTDFFRYNFDFKKAYIFEPIPETYQYLKKKYQNNKEIYTFNKLVGEQNSSQYFNLSPHLRSSSIKEINKNSLYFKIKKFFLGNFYENKLKIDQIKLDNFINKIKSIDILKIDVEGNELEVLKGSEDLLNKKAIKVIYIEILNHNLYQGYSKKRIHDFLIKKNFNLYKTYKTNLLFAEDRLYVLQDLIN